MTRTSPQPTQAVVTLILPGPDRKRSHSLYHYRVTYRNPENADSGCVMTWEVAGGREPYQISVERKDDGEIVWHCTCADAVYRGEDPHKHVCKHVEGITQLFDAVRPAVAA